MMWVMMERDSVCYSFFFFFKQKTAYEMRISDWSSDVCSSDLAPATAERPAPGSGRHAEGDPAANHRVALKGGRCVPLERRGSNGDPGAGGIAMKLAYVDLCGFRGYRKRMRLDFAEDFTILDGRNGVGKSTIFDAVEFALTGHLSKYKDAKADGETVADYIWWAGNGDRKSTRLNYSH